MAIMETVSYVKVTATIAELLLIFFVFHLIALRAPQPTPGAPTESEPEHAVCWAWVSFWVTSLSTYLLRYGLSGHTLNFDYNRPSVIAIGGFQLLIDSLLLIFVVRRASSAIFTAKILKSSPRYGLLIGCILATSLAKFLQDDPVFSIIQVLIDVVAPVFYLLVPMVWRPSGTEWTWYTFAFQLPPDTGHPKRVLEDNSRFLWRVSFFLNGLIFSLITTFSILSFGTPSSEFDATRALDLTIIICKMMATYESLRLSWIRSPVGQSQPETVHNLAEQSRAGN
eukprot:TRINITY_DN7068_c0_g1_i1.p1 TRINITY_DN7068_c0_g1~~TRINITY_DN7068_c0_g1_i1.p1  ORF type:complete len:282 (+),score=48.31 TRINITY_DN7068_c0_g1_i1:518-1363(+)